MCHLNSLSDSGQQKQEIKGIWKLIGTRLIHTFLNFKEAKKQLRRQMSVGRNIKKDWELNP